MSGLKGTGREDQSACPGQETSKPEVSFLLHTASGKGQEVTVLSLQRKSWGQKVRLLSGATWIGKT